MFGLVWNKRSSNESAHPLADVGNAARLIRELPVDSPGSALAEASAWLESIEGEPFAPSHRLNVITMIDEAVDASVDELTLAYLGAAAGNPGQPSDWRVLMDYLDRLAAAYAGIADVCSEKRNDGLATRLPLVLVRTLRTLTRSMKISWLRYLPPDRASWEAVVRCFRTARGRALSRTMVTAYPTDAEPSCALFELSACVMFAAAAPQSLTPRQVEVAYRVTAANRSLFAVNEGRDEQWRHYLFDLDSAGPPARIPEQLAAGADVMFFSAESVLSHLRPLVTPSADGAALMPDIKFGAEFGATEKRAALEHVLRFWDDSPPARRDERTALNTRIDVEIGGAAIRRVLERAFEPAKPDNDLCMLDVAVDGAATRSVDPVATLHTWTLTDFSTRGIGARFTRRLDRWLKVGSLIGFKLESSTRWSVAIVRRLRTDARNQTDVGCELLAGSAALVTLEGLASAGTLLEVSGSGPMVRTTAVMLPADAQLHARASLLFEPGTNAPGQCFVMHAADCSHRIRLRSGAETMDGWERVEFDVLD